MTSRLEVEVERAARVIDPDAWAVADSARRAFDLSATEMNHILSGKVGPSLAKARKIVRPLLSEIEGLRENAARSRPGYDECSLASAETEPSAAPVRSEGGE